MIRHQCSKAFGRSIQCHPVSALGFIAVFTLLHVFIIRHGNRDTDISPHNPIMGQVIGNQSDLSNTESMKMTNTEDASMKSKPPMSKIKKQICTVPSELPEVLNERKKSAESACERLREELPLRWKRKNRGPSSGILSKLRWNTRKHLLYCHLPKVASTTWAWHLLRSAGLKDEEIAAHRNVHILLQERLPPPSVEDYENGFLQDALAFVVSRHPFHRLVSAYKNKILEAEKRRQHYVDVRKTILEKYHRPGDIPAAMPTFRDFSEYVADTIENWLKDIDHTSPPDPHWMPMTYVCSPCNLRYDIFSKMETMEADTNFISAQCGLDHVMKTRVMLNPSNAKLTEEVHVNKIESSTSSSYLTERNSTELPAIETSETYAEYFTELSHDELERLHRIYRFDFEIFRYKVDEFR